MPVFVPTECDSLDIRYRKNIQLTKQTNIPVCYVSPTCELDIINVSTTDVSVRGGSDGQIQASVSGNTGSTITWILNGTTQTETGTSITITGLEAGFYNLLAQEGNCQSLEQDIQVIDGEFRTGDMTVISPANLTASENPIIYNIRSSQSGEGKNAKCRVSIGTDTVNDGDYFKFVLNSPFEYTQTFYAKGFPNQSNYFLASNLTDDNGVNVGSNSNTEIAQSLADALQQDNFIPKIYRISYDGNRTITLTAREVGERFTLNTKNILTNTSNFNVNQVDEGSNSFDGQQLDGYSIYVEVFQNDNLLQYPNAGNSVDYVRIAELELPFNQNNIHRFDLSPILKNFVSTSRPNYNATGYTIQPNMLKPYFIRYGEKYPVVKNTNTKKKRFKGSTDIKWYINSALDHYIKNDMLNQGFLGNEGYYHNLDPNFTGSIIVGDSGDTISFNIDDYLYNENSNRTINIKFRFYDEDMNYDSGWIASNTYEMTGITEGLLVGTIEVSGTTSGITVNYERGWWAYLHHDYGHITTREWAVQIVKDVKFLTNAPNPKLIQRNSQEYLYFILQAGYNSKLDVRGDLYFYDGTEELNQTFFTIQEAGDNDAGGVLALNLSYDKLGLATYESSGNTQRRIKRAEFAIYQTDQDDNLIPYTEKKSYRFEIADRPRKYGIVFQNKLGGFDSVDFVGIVEETINRESGTFTLPINYSQDGSAPQGFKSKTTFDTRVTNKIITNTGWIDQEHFDWLMELMQSNEIYSYTTTNQNYLNLESFKYKKSSLDDLYEVECTFTETTYLNSIDV